MLCDVSGGLSFGQCWKNISIIEINLCFENVVSLIRKKKVEFDDELFNLLWN